MRFNSLFTGLTILCVLVAVHGATQADTISWASAISGNWNDPTKWDSGTVPTAGDDVVIDASGADYTVTLNTNATVASFTLNSANATFYASSRTFTVNGPSALTSGKVEWVNSTWAGTGTLTNNAAIQIRGNSTISCTFVQNSDVNINGQSGLSAKLTVTSGFTNNGTITLENLTGPNSSELTVSSGILTNEGTITANYNTGDISANLINNGTVSINDDTQFNMVNGIYTNNATFTIADGVTLTITGNNQQFNQEGGTLTAGSGTFRMQNATFNFNGGTISDTPVSSTRRSISGRGPRAQPPSPCVVRAVR